MTKVSFELFPPATKIGQEKLHHTRQKLKVFAPQYFSVTYGAGGSTRDNTLSLVLDIQQDGDCVAPHLSFGADNENCIRELLQCYVDNGVSKLVALRGDSLTVDNKVKPVYARQLVEFVRTEFGNHFDIAVACYPEVHPQAESYKDDVAKLKMKLDAGANYAISQYFYNLDAFLYFRDACDKAGINQPIWPGIMPVTDKARLLRFSQSCGAEVPRWLRLALDEQSSEEDLLTLAEDVVTKLCVRLLEHGVPGFHFYTMNQYEATAKICHNLGL